MSDDTSDMKFEKGILNALMGRGGGVVGCKS